MLKLFLTDLKMMLRNRQAFFWSLMFPLMFTGIFGLFFGGNSSIAGSIVIKNNSKTELAQNLEKTLVDSKVFDIKNETNVDTAKELVKKGQLSAVVIVPESFGELTPNADNKVNIYYDQGNAQANATLSGIISQYLTVSNLKVQNAKPIFGIEEEKSNQRTLNYFDFVLAGVLGMALMNSSIIGIAVGMAKYREDKILKRITTTPLKTWKFIISEVITRLVLNVIQIAIILSFGIFVFHAHIYGSIPLIFALAMMGGILFQLIGFVIASLSKTTQAAEGMATAITIPMMFLSGVFFPIDSLPKWLVGFVQILPLAPLLRIIRGVALDATSPFVNPINMIIVTSWIIVTLIFSAYKFRLAEE
ncbi:MAG: ABC transporter permease [Patescibacteria group bacterium]|jgi:ABC-2 type transport system permease protein